MASGLLALAACSGPPAHARGSSSPPPRSMAGGQGGQPATTPPAVAAQLTPAQARQVFDAFLPRFDAMVSGHRAGLAGQLTQGAEAQVKEFAAAHAAGLPVARQDSERFYVPRLAAYPRWFVAVGTTRAGGDLFVLAQDQSGGPWREAYTLIFGSPPAALAGIALDARGYATAVAPGDASLAAPPGQLAARYARFLGGAGGASAAGGAGFAAGEATTGWVASRQRVTSGAPPDGWSVRFGYAAPALPVYALHATGGGAVVFFAIAQDSSWTARSSSPRFSPSLTSVDGRMPLVVAVEAGLSSIHLRPGTRISSTWLYESVAADPPRGQGKITLLPPALDGGGVTAATKT